MRVLMLTENLQMFSSKFLKIMVINYSYHIGGPDDAIEKFVDTS